MDNSLLNYLTQNFIDLKQGQKIVLPKGLTHEELEMIKNKATELNLTFSYCEDDPSSIIISKE